MRLSRHRQRPSDSKIIRIIIGPMMPRSRQVRMSITPSHHSAAHHSHHSAVITEEAVLIAVFRFRLGGGTLSGRRKLWAAGAWAPAAIAPQARIAAAVVNMSACFRILTSLMGDHTPKTVAHSTSPEKNRSLTKRTRCHSSSTRRRCFSREARYCRLGMTVSGREGQLH